jgi:endoglucanase
LWPLEILRGDPGKPLNRPLAMAPRRKQPRRWLTATLISLALLLGGGGILWAMFGLTGRVEAVAPSRPALVGINLDGAEFGKEGVYRGVYGTDYIYPDAKVAQPFLAVGMNVVRLPIRWERIQPQAFGPLDPDEAVRLDTAIRELSGFRAIIIDIHNYAKYYDVRLTAAPRDSAMLADLWTKIAQRYRTNPKIIYGLMNEPVDLPATAWRGIAEASVAAIRAQGVHNLILVPGVDWTNARLWTAPEAGANATVMAGFKDPGNNFAYEMHQYFDEDSSGRYPDCIETARAVDRLRGATAWVRQQGGRAFLGEFGVGPNPHCQEVLDAVLGYVDANSDVWMGWSVFTGGDWWGDLPFSIQPDAQGHEKPQMRILRRHIAAQNVAPQP